MQHIVMYFQACSNLAYPMHLSERSRTTGPLVVYMTVNYKVAFV